MSVKAVAIAIKLTFSGMNQFKYFHAWIFIIVVTICCILQINYLNKVITKFGFIVTLQFFLTNKILFSSLQALDNFNTAVISPVYYVMFTTFTILASMIMFKVKYGY